QPVAAQGRRRAGPEDRREGGELLRRLRRLQGGDRRLRRGAALHAAALPAGKHLFVEKPVAVDTPGAHRILKACREAKGKNISIVSGLCYRYEKAKRE